MKSTADIIAIIDSANALIEEGGIFYGLSYEDGVKAALEWATEVTDDSPLDQKEYYDEE